MQIIPNWHPIFVHFSVALLSVAALLKLGAFFISNDSLRKQLDLVARWNLWIGAGFVVLTVIAGVFAYNTVSHDTPSHAAMTDHRNWALVTAAIFLLIAGWRGMVARAGKPSGGLFVVILLAATGLLGVTAWKGGELVYRYGLGVMSLPKADTHEHAEGEQHDHGAGMEDDHHDDSNLQSETQTPDHHHDDVKELDDHHHDNSDGHHDQPSTTVSTSSTSATQSATETDDHFADGHTH